MCSSNHTKKMSTNKSALRHGPIHAVALFMATYNHKHTFSQMSFTSMGEHDTESLTVKVLDLHIRFLLLNLKQYKVPLQGDRIFYAECFGVSI